MPPSTTAEMASPYFLPLLLVLLALPATAADICDPESDAKTPPHGSTLVLKLVAIASILFSGGLGILIPILGRSVPALQPDRDAFFVVKAFAAGVILATGLVHILPDAFRSLTSPCLPERPWRRFPLAGFAAMASAMATLVIDTLATSYYRRSHLSKATPADVEEGGGGTGDGTGSSAMHVHTHASHGHTHGSAAADDEPGGLSERIRHRVVAQVLELGIVVHSVIIGISLGASYNKGTIRPLVGALSFHQFFEGMGLGGCIVQARFRANSVAVMTLFFSLTTPLGIVSGIGISSFYDERSPRAVAVEGVLNAASAGILIYMSLVDLLAADFASAKMQTSGKLQVWSYCALFLGAGLMSLVAVWA